MTEEQIITLREHLAELRLKTVLRLAALSEAGSTDLGLVTMAANIQNALVALEAVEEG